MGTTVEQRRRISRYAILVLFMFLVAGSLSTENHWPVFAAITGQADPPSPGGDVASAALELRDVTSGSPQDTSQQLRDIAQNALSASGIGGGNGPVNQDRPPEVGPLEFAAAAANPPADPPELPNPPDRDTGRPDNVGPSGGGGACGGGRGPGFTPPGCLVREVAWTLGGDMSKEERIATAHSLRTVAADAVAANKAAYPPPGRPDLPTVSSSRPDLPERPSIPERPEIAERPTLPERPNIPEPPGRPGQ